MKHSKWMKLLAILFAFTLVAAACGDDDDDDGGDAGAEETDAGDEGADDGGDDAGDSALGGDDGGEDAGDDAGEDDMGDDAGEETGEDDMGDDAGEETGEDDMGDGEEMAGGLADDSVHGQGAEAFEAAVAAGPVPADEGAEPIKIFMTNLEGSPGGSFPEVSEGFEIGVDYINNHLGGIGGAPIEFELCAHLIDDAEAQACATEAATSGANLIVNGIDFYTPLFYPTWEGLPVINFLPIFVSDFDTPANATFSGGCAVAFPGAMLEMVREDGIDYVAVPYSDNAPGQQCWADTQERPLQYLLDQGEIIGFKGYPELAGDPSDNDANVQQILADIEASGAENPAIHYGIAASDCAEYQDALAAAGNTYPIYASGSCVDDAVLTASASAGIKFGWVGYLVDNPEAYDEYIGWELGMREQVLADANPEAPLSTFMRGGFSNAIYVWALMNEILADGGDPTDGSAVQAYFTSVGEHHAVGSPPLNCSLASEDYESICQWEESFNEWTGTEWIPDDTGFTNVAQFVAEYSAAVPRPEAG